MTTRLETRTSHGISKTDATGPFALTVRPINGRGSIRMARNPRYPLTGHLDPEELDHFADLCREAAQWLRAEQARAA